MSAGPVRRGRPRWCTSGPARLGAVGAGLAILAAACSSHQRALPVTTTSAPTTSTTVAATTTTSPPLPVLPLTGIGRPSASQLRAPAVVVKIDNVDAARPQTGLGQADVVYEEMVEGGLTRLAAVFQSVYPAVAGPVRSGRLTDEGIADDLNHPVYVFSGTNAIFLPVLVGQPVIAVYQMNHPEMFFRYGGNIPHNLYTSVSKVASLGRATPPLPLFSFLSAGQPFGGGEASPAASVAISFPAATATWTYSPAAHAWLRWQNGTPDVDSTGRQIRADNVLVMFVSYVTSGVATGEGVAPSPIPEAILTGAGPLWALSGPALAKGTWARDSLPAAAVLTSASGSELKLAPGRTWVELVPLGSTPAVTP